MTFGKRSPQLIFLVIGGLLLAVAFLIDAQASPSQLLKFLGSASQDVAFIILTVVIVDFLWGVLGGEPVSQALNALGVTLRDMRISVQLLEDSRKTGLERALSVSGAFGSHHDWMNRLKSAHSQIDLMGHSLHIWTSGENFEQEVVQLVLAGVRMRVLIMDENNEGIETIVNAEQIPSVSVVGTKEQIRLARKVFKSISDHLATLTPLGAFEFKTLTKGVIVCQLCRTDFELTMVQYLYSVVGSRSPLLVIRGYDSQLFQVYMREFEQLWELGVSS